MAVLTLPRSGQRSGGIAWGAALDGARDMAPVVLALAPLGLLAGAHVAESPVRDDVGLVGGMLVYGASAHITAVSLLGAGAGMLAVVATVLVINARGLVYSAALAARMQAEPVWFRWAAPFLLVDPLFALVSRRADAHGWGDEMRAYYLGAGLTLWCAWFWVMLAGVVAGPALPEAEWLRFAVPCAFVGFLVPGLRDRSSYVSAAGGGIVALLALGLPGGIGLVLAAGAGAALGTAADRIAR